MKLRLILPLFAAITITFSSCSSDDQEGLSPEATKLVGKWINDGLTVDNEEKEASGDQLHFNSNGTLKTISDVDTESGTFHLDGDELTLKTSTEMTFELLEVTETEMILFFNTDYDGSGDLDDVEIHFSKME